MPESGGRAVLKLPSEGEIRSQAVENVDARHGYTVEFSNSPHAHLLEYDEEEERIRSSLLEGQGR